MLRFALGETLVSTRGIDISVAVSIGTAPIASRTMGCQLPATVEAVQVI